MRAIIPFIFWPWFLVSCGILINRRLGRGTRRDTVDTPIPEIEAQVSEPALTRLTAPEAAVLPTPSRLAAPTAPTLPASTLPPSTLVRSRSLAEALDGIVMPCELAPLIGTGPANPREVSFFNHGFEAATVGTALSDELERLGYVLTPEDDRTIRADRDDDVIRATLVSAALDSETILHERHPTAPADAVVVELRLI